MTADARYRHLRPRRRGTDLIAQAPAWTAQAVCARVTTPHGPGTIAEEPVLMASGWTVRVDLDTPATASGHARYTLAEINPEDV